MTKKLVIGILVGAGALGATVAYYRHRFLEHFRLQVDSVQDHEVGSDDWFLDQVNPDLCDAVREELHHG